MIEHERVVPNFDESVLAHLQTLTPAERIALHEGALDLVKALRKASAVHRGARQNPLARTMASESPSAGLSLSSSCRRT